MFSDADAYEHFMGRWSRLLATELVGFAEITDGDAVLDVGSGTGALAFAVRDATKTASVTGIDPSPQYVARAARDAADARVRFQVAGAEQLPFPDASFDTTLSMLVLNFVPDPARAAAEMSRVTRAAGTVAAALWDYADGMEMLRAFWDEATALHPESAPRDEAHMPLCKQGELAALFREAGLERVTEAPLTARLRFASFDDYWDPFLLGQGPAGAYVASLDEKRRGELRERLRLRVCGDTRGRPFELRARAWAAKGTVSA